MWYCLDELKGELEADHCFLSVVCLTDSDTCNCCLMQTQMMRMESFFNMSLNEMRKNLEKAETALNYVRCE